MKTKIIAGIDALMAVLLAVSLGFSGLIEKGNWSRKIAHFGCMFLTYDSYAWAKHFAETTERTGLEVPGIIGAVLAAVSALQGYVFKTFANTSPRTRTASTTHTEESTVTDK